jgi:hypothetical protein
MHACLLPYGDSHILRAVWLDHFWRSCPLFSLEYFIKRFVPKTPYMFNMNSSKLYMLAYHMQIHISLWQFHQLISDGVIALFSWHNCLMRTKGSDEVLASVVCILFKNLMKSLYQFEPHLAWMILRVFMLKCVLWPHPPSNMSAVTINRNHIVMEMLHWRNVPYIRIVLLVDRKSKMTTHPGTKF